MATGLNKKYITQTEHILTIQVSLLRLKLIYICNSIDEAPEGDKKTWSEQCTWPETRIASGDKHTLILKQLNIQWW